jgi:hypothetical protein
MDATPNTPGHQRRRWRARELKLLGTMSDHEVARRIGCGLSHVWQKRTALGIPAYVPVLDRPDPYQQDSPEPQEPTDARPGTVAKLEVLAARAERGEALAHPADENVFRRSPATSRRLAEMVITPAQDDDDDSD